jgi:hypothetical protein
MAAQANHFGQKLEGAFRIGSHIQEDQLQGTAAQRAAYVARRRIAVDEIDGTARQMRFEERGQLPYHARIGADNNTAPQNVRTGITILHVVAQTILESVPKK